jgi:enoyl-CoA hydratase
VFGIPTAQLGLAVDPWTVRRLAVLVGGSAAAGVLMGCDELDTARALQCGLVNRAGEPADALRWAESIAGWAPRPLAFYKRALRELLETPEPSDGLRHMFEDCWASPDVAEGQRARAERRPPRFTGA